MLTFNLTELSDITIITLHGRFDASGAAIFEEEFNKINCLYPVVDFSKVSYLSSAGIRVLLQFEKLLRTQNGKIIFSCFSPGIEQVLSITGLLGQFTSEKTIEDGIHTAQKMILSVNKKFNQLIKENNYSIRQFTENSCSCNLWFSEKNQEDKLFPVNLTEFDFALGTGGLGINRQQAVESNGRLLISKKFIGILPSKYKEEKSADYLFSENPNDTFFYLSSAVNFSGKPNMLIEIGNVKPISFKELINDIYSIISDLYSESIPLVGFVLIASTAAGEGVLSVGITLDKFGSNINSSSEIDFTSILLNENLIPINDTLYYSSSAISLKTLDGLSSNDDILENINSVLYSDNISDLEIPDLNSSITSAKIWAFIPGQFIKAEHTRLQIEFENEFELLDEFEIIIRKIYSDCNRIILNQLHGGFSAKTFQVFGYDKKGIRILPTVLKLARLSTIKREVENFNKNVKPYILNNSTSVMGSCYYGEFGGVRYNFVGITGPDSKIKWLTHDYIVKSAEELLPVFDKIFTDVLRPWYGQPRLETFSPYKEHDPTKVFFPELFEKCKSEFGISADEEKIFSAELGREIINPYWFLKHGYKKRENNSKLWYKCICHGDLNMQNILLDEMMNVYIIDYSETSPRNAVADFARLEPIFKFEFTKLDSEDDLKSLLQFEQGLLSPDKLDEIPDFTYSGSDTAVLKAYKLICRLRQYANTVTLFETDIIPYLLAVLEWTFAVVCYESVDLIRKRYSALSAALICEKIIELEKKK